MNIVKFKVKSYDEISNSLIISFASDTTSSQDPENYTAYAFQPTTMWPDVTDIDELKKLIAKSGLHHAQIQESKEKFVINTDRVESIKSLVGKTYEYTVAELTEAAEENTPIQTV